MRNYNFMFDLCISGGREFLVGQFTFSAMSSMRNICLLKELIWIFARVIVTVQSFD